MEIFALVTGVLFLLLEIKQHNLMWLLQAISGAASVVVFFRQGLYASMGLNVNYVIMAVWGYVQWRRDSASVDSGAVHLRRITLPVVLVSIAAQIAGTILFLYLLRILGDSMSGLDAGVTVLSVIATWWLVRSYKEQWLLWIIADVLMVVMCLCQSLWWMSALYFFYTVSAVYGFVYWKRQGEYL
ncbi:MAG: nicotinamide riboside transporter PnuC [Candidatus Cryptobacteroides sp.]